MRNKVLVICLVANLLAAPQLMLAQEVASTDKSNWDTLKVVPPGDEVVVKTRNGKTIKGRLSNSGDGAITLSRDKKTEDIKREDVLSVYRVIPKSAKRASLIGLAIGGGAGAISGGVATRGGESGEHYAVLITAGLGAGIGAVTGYLLGSRNQRVLIYQAK